MRAHIGHPCHSKTPSSDKQLRREEEEEQEENEKEEKSKEDKAIVIKTPSSDRQPQERKGEMRGEERRNERRKNRSKYRFTPTKKRRHSSFFLHIHQLTLYLVPSFLTYRFHSLSVRFLFLFFLHSSPSPTSNTKRTDSSDESAFIPVVEIDEFIAAN